MADEATGTATATADPTGSASPAATPATTSPAGSAGQGGDGDFVRVPREALKEYGGDWHKAAQHAAAARHYEPLAQFAEAQGVAVPELVQFLLDQLNSNAIEGGGDGEPATTPESKPAETGAPKTPASTEETIRKVLREEREAQEKASKEKSDKEARDRAQETEAQRATAFTASFKAEGVEARHLSRSFYANLLDAIGERLVAEGRATVQNAGRLALGQIATDADYTRGEELARQEFTDLCNVVGARMASGQTGIPSSTLGDGRGGATPPPKSWDQMTRDERIAATVAGIPKDGFGSE